MPDALHRLSTEEIERARTRFDIIAGEVALKRKGRELAGLCPFHNEKTPSFYVAPDKGFYHCFGCGAHGTALDYVMRVHGLSFVGAVREINGSSPRKAKEQAPLPVRTAEPARRDTVVDVERILRESRSLEPGTAAFLYLQTRGLISRYNRAPWEAALAALRAHDALYCHEAKQDLPALVAPITSSQGVTAVQRIWVLPRVEYVNGAGPRDSRAPLAVRKKTLGEMLDGAVRLAPTRRVLGFAEGIETAIAAALMNRGIPVWATCGTARFGFPGHWRERHTEAAKPPTLWIPPDEPPRGVETIWIDERPPRIWIPDSVDRIVIFGDRGFAGETAAQYAADYWYRAGLDTEVRFPAARFGDFNDQLLAETVRC